MIIYRPSRLQTGYKEIISTRNMSIYTSHYNNMIYVIDQEITQDLF